MKPCEKQIQLTKDELLTIAEMIKKRRKELGITSGEKLSHETGLNMGTINKLETAGNKNGINRDTLFRLTSVLKCDLDYLLGKSEYPTKLDEQLDKVNKRRKEMINQLASSHSKESLLSNMLSNLNMATSVEDRFVFEQSHIDSFANHSAFERYIYGRFSSNCLRVSQTNGKSFYLKKSDMDQIYSDLYHYLEMLISHYGMEAPDGVLSVDAPEIELSDEELVSFQCMTAKQYWKQYNKSPEKYMTITRQKAKENN